MIENFSAPFEATLMLTYGCNLHCPFCYEHAWGKRDGREIPPSGWLKILHELAEMQVMNLRLLGGEPLLSPAFEPLVREISHMKMRFAVISNGTLFDEARVRLLAECGRCSIVQLSLDGIEALHDRMRGSGNFRKTVSAIHMLHDSGVKVKINSVILRSSIPQVPALLELLVSLPITSYRINPVDGTFLPTEKMDYDDFAELGILLLNRKDKLKKINPKSFPFVLLNLIHYHEEDNDESGRCFRSHVQINIHPDGAVTPCPDAKTPVCGYALQQPLREIWAGEVFNEFRRRSRKDVCLPFSLCRECEFRAVCRHYCLLSSPEELCFKELLKRWREKGVEL